MNEFFEMTLFSLSLFWSIEQINISDMNKSSSSYLYQFSWEEWDHQYIVVLYR